MRTTMVTALVAMLPGVLTDDGVVAATLDTGGAVTYRRFC